MGLDLTYDAEGVTFNHHLFSRADWKTIEALRTHLPEQIGVCFNVPELGEPIRVKSAALKQSALNIDHLLSDKAAQFVQRRVAHALGHTRRRRSMILYARRVRALHENHSAIPPMDCV